MDWEGCLEEAKNSNKENLVFSQLAKNYNLQNKEGSLPGNGGKKTLSNK